MRGIDGCLFLKTGWLLLSLLIQAAPGMAADAPGASGVPTEKDVLRSFVEVGAHPALSQTAASAARLKDATQNLCARPNKDTLDNARTAWRQTFLAWRKAEPFMFDAASKLEARLGRWPANNVVLDAAVSSSEYRDIRGEADARGFAAVEYLLFAPKDAAAATAGERCAHLKDVTGEIAGIFGGIADDWKTRLGKEFMSAGDGKPFLVPDDALGMAVTKMFGVTERMLRDRIGLPGGLFGEPPKPDNLEAWRGGRADAGLVATAEGLRLALNGDGKTGILRLVADRDGLVEKRNPALAAKILRQLDKIEKTVSGFGGSERLHADPTKMKGLYRQVQQLQDQLIEAALVLELDVNVLELGARTRW
ncbi:MAG: imelysin family protein [Acidobacteriota bacterium]|nr:imelysin family protein [Acidobacteriota bacterium]